MAESTPTSFRLAKQKELYFANQTKSQILKRWGNQFYKLNTKTLEKDKLSKRVVFYNKIYIKTTTYSFTMYSSM